MNYAPLASDKKHYSGKFRSDINGLRAWAVFSVVLFHFQIPGFAGGFVGVDVFFVISGYLMAKIIILGLERGSFSLVGFYVARARRIIPALAALCAVLVLLGWVVLIPGEYRQLSNHVISSLLFISNIKYWRENGYFDAASHEKWLLHTWSLSLEWQFYLLLPLVLIIAWKIYPKRAAIALGFGLAFLVSLCLSLFVAGLDSVAAFYLLPTRGWELLAGGLVFLCGSVVTLRQRTTNILEWFGLALVFSSILVFSSKTEWPSGWATVPVLGTALVILAGRQNSPWTGSTFFQWSGTRSYSIYLWHWPVYAMLVYLELDKNAVAVVAGIIASFVMGGISYSLLENSPRDRLQTLSAVRASVAITLGVLAVSIPAFAVRALNGVESRLDPEALTIAAEARNKNPRKEECHVDASLPVPKCKYGGDVLGVIVIGDSHAASMVRAIEDALPQPSLHVLDWTMESCPTVANVRMTKGSPNSRSKCREFIQWALRESARLPRNAPMIIVNRSSMYAFGPNEEAREGEPFPAIYFDAPVNEPTDEFLKRYSDGIVFTACEFAKTRDVYLVRPTPELRLDVPKTVGRSMMRGATVEVSIGVDEYRKRHAFIWRAQDVAKEQCGVKILDVLPYLCDDSKCYGMKGGRPLYYDDDHLSEFGARELAPLWRGVFLAP